MDPKQYGRPDAPATKSGLASSGAAIERTLRLLDYAQEKFIAAAVRMQECRVRIRTAMWLMQPDE